MCGSKGSYPISEAAQLAQYQRLVQQQPADWNGYGEDLKALVRKATEVVPQVTARELTKEELRERVERKLDLSEAAATDPVELINLGRWRQIMDEVFKDDNKGGEDGKRTQEGKHGCERRSDGGGDDAG